MTETKARQAGKQPRIVGRYALYDEIASGGMATVHFGRLLGPVGFSRPVAIKRLHPHHAKDPSFTKMFIDEARLASRILHPNVVPTLDVVNEDGELLLVMEYVQGESLGRLLRLAIEREDPVPLRVALTIMSNALHGLHAAHEAKTETGEALEIVHRDVSPQNVIVSTDGVARVLDFGIACAKLRLEETDEGNIKGKVSYMAPEQLAGATLDRRTDVYAAAVILWELFAGQRLWQRADAQTSLIQKMFKPVERPSLYRPELPDALEAIVLHGLERDPERRFATAREFALAIEQYGPLATPSEVGAWVERMAKDALSARSLKVAGFESAPPVTVDSSPDRQERPPLLTMRSDTYPVTRERPTLPDSGAARTEGTAAKGVPIAAIRITRPSISRPFPAPGTKKRGPWRRHLTKAAIALVWGGAAVGIWLVARPAPGTSGEAHAPRESAATADRAAIATTVGACPAGMALVAGGKMFMGDDDGSALERPAHQVAIAAFCIDVLEVTVGEYKACSDRGDCKRATATNEWDGLTAGDARTLDALCNARDPERRKAHPINCVGWDSSQAYCAAQGKRLPTEAEWEYAARGSDGRKYPWGDDPPNPMLLNACGRECAELGKQSRLPLDALVPLYGGDDGWPTTSPVGSFPRGRSRFGVEDLAGNVWEWTADWFAPYTTDAQIDPKGPASGKFRVVRGGAWNSSSAASLRPTLRHKDPPEKRSFAVGFRCALTPK
jgi:formylglycine-generating enzyme required for sulfatase activity/serine/threonine protein kinase